MALATSSAARLAKLARRPGPFEHFIAGYPLD
jgi:hypothetical protein